MSWRKLVEINCDRRPKNPAAMLAFAERLWAFLGCGDPKLLPDGVTFVQSRHHSESSPTGWTPPRDVEHGYRRLGLCGGEWRGVMWDGQPHHHWAKPYWAVEGWKPTRSRAFQPTAFAPFPTSDNTGGG